jgi:ATP-dependent exoDNAse (exonuclease V) alpha subunit
VTKARDITTDVVGKVNEHTGLTLTEPKQPIALSVEQRAAVLNILNGNDISVLEGIPGAGKTTAMRELVRQYQKAGCKVIGVTPSSSASLELAKSTGIECRNASLWRKIWMEAAGKEFELILRGDYYKEKLYRDGSRGLTKNHVMIIDEASMGELANMDYLINQAKAVGAKVIFVGDRNQLSPVGWTGALGKAINICGSEKLEESRRQQNELHQEATKLLGRYRVREALDIFRQEGSIKVSATAAESNSECIKEFVKKYIEQSSALDRDDLVSTKTIAIGVFENKTRQLYNMMVRKQLKEAGVLKGQEYSFHVGAIKGEKQFLKLARGEQIVFSRNANHLGRGGIFNGELGTILKVRSPNPDGHGIIDILVHKASGNKEQVSLDLKELATSRWFNDGVNSLRVSTFGV